MASPRRMLRAVARFAASVLAVSGALLMADAAVTVAWQEPLSALFAGRQQAALEDALADTARQFDRDRPRPRAAPPSRRELAAGARRLARATGTGDALGRLVMPTLRRSYVVIEGTDPGTLRRGPGHYPGTALPGLRGTVAIAGHRTTYGAPFRTIDRLRRGDRLELRLPYARVRYSVEGSRIVAPTAVEVTRRVDHDRLVLTACHPLYSAAQRIVVFARQTGVAAP